MKAALAAWLPRFFCALVLASGFASPASAAGGDLPQVYFAGIAYTGAAQQAAERLPYTNAALQRQGHRDVNDRLWQALSARPPVHLRLQRGELAALDGSGSAVVVAVAIDRETVTVERIAGQYKLLFELAAQALFFDFRERQVLFSYPITLQRIDVFPNEPTHEQIQAVADQLLRETGPNGFATAFAEEVAPLGLPSASSRRIQLTEVRVADAASARVPADKANPELIGHEFTKVLASTLRLPMLPHRGGQAIGGAMATRFADGTVYNLTIPEPDYRLVLEVSDFRDKVLTQTPAFRQQLYGAFFRVRVEEPLSAKVYFDQPLRHGETKAIPASQEQVDSAAAYYETMLAGFASFARAAGGGNAAWSREQTGGRDFASQLKSLKELIGQCR